MNQEGPSNRRSLGERTVNVSALNRSKLTVREGEIGIVRVSAATLNHLMNQQPKEEMDHLNSTGGYGFVGLFRSDQLVEMLGDHGLERSIVSGEESLTALHGHGWGTEVDAVSKDGMTNLNIVTDDGFRAISSSLSIHNGYVVLLSLGNSPQGEPNGGLVYIAGGKGEPNDAQHSLGADQW